MTKSNIIIGIIGAVVVIGLPKEGSRSWIPEIFTLYEGPSLY